MLRIGLVGAGGIGRSHLATFRHIEGVRGVGVADPVIERARDLAALVGAEAHTDERALLGTVDVVWVCTPPLLHRDQTLAFADAGSLQTGDRVFVVSGLGIGSGGASISQGTVADVAANAIQHDAGVGAAHRGGPLLDPEGKVVGVASRTYAPLGFDPLAVFFSPPIGLACESVIRCPDGGAAPPG